MKGVDYMGGFAMRSKLEAYAPLVSPGSYCRCSTHFLMICRRDFTLNAPGTLTIIQKRRYRVSSKKAIISKSTAAFLTVWPLALSSTVFSNAFAEPKVVPNSLMYK